MALEIGTQAAARSEFSTEMLLPPAYAVGTKGRWRRRLRLASAMSAFQNQRRRSFCCTSVLSKPPRCQEAPYFDKLVELLERMSWMLQQPGAEVHRISLRALPCARDEIGEGRQGSSHQLFQQCSYSNNTKPLLGDRFGEGGGGGPSFYVVRDDLLHPLINGNKARKLDAVLPVLQRHSVSDVVTCGGCQSAHAAAVAVSCAERGIRSHLLLRGEQLETMTGYNLVSHMYGNVTYVPRCLYAKREEMLRVHADAVAADLGSVLLLDDFVDGSLSTFDGHVDEKASSFQIDNCYKKVAIINEGAANILALLGVFRLVHYLSQPHVFGRHPLKIVLDAGTGVTAIGFGLAIELLGLSWETIAVMLADTADKYRHQEKKLITEFKRLYGLEYGNSFSCTQVTNNVQWIERIFPRSGLEMGYWCIFIYSLSLNNCLMGMLENKHSVSIIHGKFGKVLKGETRTCQHIAQQTGVLLDPIYTLSAWEHASLLSQTEPDSSKVVMLHTGGTLGLFGLAQRCRAGFLKEHEK